MHFFALSVSPLKCFDECDCFFSIGDGTNTMDCSNKDLSELPQTIIPSTEKLIMKGNKLGMLETVDNQLSQIAIFQLDSSGITRISDYAMRRLLQKSDEIILSWNNLTVFPTSIQEMENKTKLWLGDNPYECNCDMMWMRDWLLNATNVMDKDRITCASGEWKGKAMDSIKFFILLQSFVICTRCLVCCHFRLTNLQTGQKFVGMWTQSSCLDCRDYCSCCCCHCCCDHSEQKVECHQIFPVHEIQLSCQRR